MYVKAKNRVREILQNTGKKESRRQTNQKTEKERESKG